VGRTAHQLRVMNRAGTFPAKRTVTGQRYYTEAAAPGMMAGVALAAIAEWLWLTVGRGAKWVWFRLGFGPVGTPSTTVSHWGAHTFVDVLRRRGATCTSPRVGGRFVWQQSGPTMLPANTSPASASGSQRGAR